MKILLLIPDAYSLKKSFSTAFNNLGHVVESINYIDIFPLWQNRLISKTIGLPHKVRKKIKIHEYYRNKINQIYLEKIYERQPDLVLVYNDQYLNLKTAMQIKKMSKLAFMLGDNPFFFHNHPPEELGMYLKADYVFSCDSFISESFQKSGQSNATEIYLGYDPNVCYPKVPSEEEKIKYRNDVVMIGRLYPTIISSWTYKRLWFYHQFRNLDLKIYGHGWRRYQREFPELLSKVTDLVHYLSFDEINTIVSSCKVYPIDANPGIINGIHLRVFDCIGSEILPLVEYTKDLERVFSDVEIPMIRDYNKVEEVARYYIEHDEKRKKIKKELKQFVDKHYTPRKAVEKILDKVLNS